MKLYPIVLLSVVSSVLASPIPRALPTPVDAATALTYLASRMSLWMSVPF
jgi:hypothetical protein